MSVSACAALLVLALAAEEPREHVDVWAPAPDEEVTDSFATTIDGETLAGRAEDLGSALGRVPGARVREFGGIGGYAILSLRASTAEQVPVYVDGVLQNRALGGPVNLAALPVGQVESIVVHRGFAPVGLGIGGIGGAVEIRTRRPDGSSAAVDALAGGYETARLTVGFSEPVGNGALRVGVEALTGEGDYDSLAGVVETPFDPSDDRLVARRNNDVRRLSLQSAFRWRRWRAELRLRNGERGIPPPLALDDSSARLEESLGEITLSRVGERAVVRVDTFSERQRFRADESFFGRTDARTHVEGARLTSTVDVESWKLVGGLGLERVALRDAAIESAPDRGGAERLEASLQAERLWRSGRWSLAPSLAVEHVADRFEGGRSAVTVPPPAEDVDSTELSGKFALAREIAAGRRLRMTLGSRHRRPSLLELFGNRGAVRGSPTLEAERAIAAELGWQQRTERWSYESVIFARRTDELIVLELQGQGVAVPRNVGEAEVVGVELAGRGELPAGFSLDGNVTWQRARDVGVVGDGARLPFQPRWAAFSALGWDGGRTSLRWEANYTGETAGSPSDLPRDRVPERVIHDLHGAVELGGGFTLGIDVQNLFDRRVLDVVRYPLPDRVVALHLGWREERAR